MDQDKCKCQQLPLILDDNLLDCSRLSDFPFQLQGYTAGRSSQGMLREHGRVQNSVKNIETEVFTLGNVIRGVSVQYRE